MAQAEDKKKKFIKASSEGAKNKFMKKDDKKKKRSVKEVRKAMYGDEGVD